MLKPLDFSSSTNNKSSPTKQNQQQQTKNGAGKGDLLMAANKFDEVNFELNTNLYYLSLKLHLKVKDFCRLNTYFFKHSIKVVFFIFVFFIYIIFPISSVQQIGLLCQRHPDQLRTFGQRRFGTSGFGIAQSDQQLIIRWR